MEWSGSWLSGVDGVPRSACAGSAAAVVPRLAGGAAAEGAAGHEGAAEEEAGVFPRGVEVEFAGGGDEGMAVEDDELFAVAAGVFFEAFAEIDFLGGKEFVAESADGAEGVGLDEDEGAGGPAADAAEEVPGVDEEAGEEVVFVELHGGAAAEAGLVGNGVGDVGKEICAGVGIGVDEDEPVASGGEGAAVAGAGDLVDGFEDDGGAGGTGEFGGAVGGVVVADDEFGLPAEVSEGEGGVADAGEGSGDEFLLVEGGDDEGDFHDGRRLKGEAQSSKFKA